MSAELQPRLTVFRLDPMLDHWVRLSHANFNFPVAAICDENALLIASEPALVNPDDMVLGESLVEQMLAYLLNEEGEWSLIALAKGS